MPVLHIVGVPSTGLQTKKALLHHTLGDGRFDAYLNCYKQFTIAQAALNKPNIRTGGSDVSDEIDRIIKAALVHCRPTYLTLPTDLVSAMIPSAPLRTPLTLESIHKSLSEPKVSEKVEKSIIKQITAMYEKAEKPIILVDACCIRYGVQNYTRELIDKTGMVRWSLVGISLPLTVLTLARHTSRLQWVRPLSTSSIHNLAASTWGISRSIR